MELTDEERRVIVARLISAVPLTHSDLASLLVVPERYVSTLEASLRSKLQRGLYGAYPQAYQKPARWAIVRGDLPT